MLRCCAKKCQELAQQKLADNFENLNYLKNQNPVYHVLQNRKYPL